MINLAMSHFLLARIEFGISFIILLFIIFTYSRYREDNYGQNNHYQNPVRDFCKEEEANENRTMRTKKKRGG